MNPTNDGKIWMDIGSPGPFLPDRPYAVNAGSGTNLAPQVQIGTISKPVNLQILGGYIYGSSPVKFSMTGSATEAGFHDAYGNHLAMMITGSIYVSGSTDTCGGTISGSIHHTRDGLSYLVAGSNVTIASASNGQVTINAANSGFTQFVLEDEDGLEQTVTNNQEIKIRGTRGLATKYGTGDGANATPYDLMLFNTGSAMSSTYSFDGPNRFFVTIANTAVFSSNGIHLVDATTEVGPAGTLMRFDHNNDNGTFAVGMRIDVPKGAAKVQFRLSGKAPSGTGAVELRLAGRLHTTGIAVSNNNAANTAGNWLDSTTLNGFRKWSGDSNTFTATSTDQIFYSEPFTIASLINNSDSSNFDQSSVIDIAIVRNRSGQTTKQINDTTNDNLDNAFLVNWIQAEFTG